jgi:hypothetical protein
VDQARKYRELVPIAVDEATTAMQMVLDAQETAATERLNRWRLRANRWHANAEQLELFGGQRKKVDTLSRRIAEEQRLAESLAPTQQLVRPLLLIVSTDVATGKDQ